MKRLLSFLICILFVISLSSCSFKGKPEKTVKAFCEAMKEFDLSEMQRCTTASNVEVPRLVDDTSPVGKTLYQYICDCAGKMEYSIKSCKVSGKKGKVTVHFSYIDSTTIINSAIAEFMPQLWALALAEANEALIETTFSGILINKAAEIKPTFIQKELVIPCEYVDSKWKISDVPNEVLDILTCNITSIQNPIDGFVSDTSTNELANGIEWHSVQGGIEKELATIKVRVLDTKEAAVIKVGDWTKTAPNGTKFVVLKIQLENITKESVFVDMANYPFKDSKDRKYEPYIDPKDDDGNWITGDSWNNTDLAPNIPKQIDVVYQVPSDSVGYHFDIIKAGTSDGYQFYGIPVKKVDANIRIGNEPPTNKGSTNGSDNVTHSTDVHDIGYVNASGGLRIRSGPSTSYEEVGRLANGQCITILEYGSDGFYEWGRIDLGWVCMDYISYEQPSGTCVMEDIHDDVLMRYEGKWGDRVGQRCIVEIYYGLTAFGIDITWGSSSSETTYWSFTAEYDETSDSLKYQNGRKTISECDSSGNMSERVQYSSGTGRFYISGGEMYWEDYTEGAGASCIFEKLQ